ncbi:hypothetical protein BH10PSE2_BH10PSE2_18080 [soil metagenome]
MRASLTILAVTATLLAACGGSDPAKTDAKSDAAAALPADVTAFVARAGECLSWSDEARAKGPHANASHDEMMAAWTTNKCETLAVDAAALRSANAGNPAVDAALNTAMNPPETAGTTETGATNAAATPDMGEAGLTKFLDKAKICSDSAAEMGDNEEQNAQIMQTWNEAGCPALEAETAATRQAYAGNAAVLARVSTAVEPLGY